VLAFRIRAAKPEDFPALRLKPGPGIGQALPHSFLKHTDEQTVLSLAAVLHAIDDFGLSATCFTDWGVVAAPCFLGRATLASALQRYESEGAWGISPHFIPHRSQHAVSGTISQALKIHGPNLGAGGGPGSAIEALLASMVLLEGSRLPGVWTTFSDWDPELVPDPQGRPLAPSVCKALALALVPSRAEWRGPRLRAVPAARGKRGRPEMTAVAKPLSTLETYLTAFSCEEMWRAAVVWPLDGGGWIELGRGGNHTAAPKRTFFQRLLGRKPLAVGQGGNGWEKKR
jgi:hypothetical protein